jgi:hypothetical protein
MQVRIVKAAGLALAGLAAAFAPVAVSPGADGGVAVRLNGACAGATTCTSSNFDICSSDNGNDYSDMKCKTGCFAQVLPKPGY